MAIERGSGELFIGETLDAESGDRTGSPVMLDSADFTTHGVIVGMTGSGKTGLGVVLLEEALLSGVPILALDPKGDLANLALTFPNLSGSDFEPWMDKGAARVKDTTVADLAADTADLWKNGLSSWDLGTSDIQQLQEAANPIIYTPGATSGVPLNALGRLSAPEADDAGVRQDEADATVAGLLGLVGVKSDPLSGREHILMTNLIIRAWDNGTTMDLPTLLGQIMDPPIRKLGVLDLDSFFPARDRQALAMKLNGLLASPSFAAWSEGVPLDPGTMMWDRAGNPRAAIVSLAHLDESERQFAITLILSRVISWMRSQPGTGELRCLIYIDEVMGLAPPVGNPPPKKPILTLLKQARAFGVGLVLSTQNPVDLDYKAISNAGTWLIGRLQTEQDKNRLVDGLRAADGSVDVAEVERQISGLGKRQFILRTTRSADLPLLTTRWAMSYLAGPMTRDQISGLMEDHKAALATSRPTPGLSGSEPASSATPSDTSAVADDESTVPPDVPASLPMKYAHKTAPWLSTVDAEPDGDRLKPVIAARVNLLFDETKAKLRAQEEWEALIPIGPDGIDVDTAIAVDFDDRDFGNDAPAGAVYVMPDTKLSASAVKAISRDLKNYLSVQETMTLQHNAALKLWSRPGESPEDFSTRCQEAADEGKDQASAKIRTKLETKYERVQAALAKAEDRVAELETQAEGRRNKQLVDIGTSILGGLLGGRSRARSMASSARRMASGRSQSASTQARLETAQNRVGEKIEELEQLEMDLQDAMIEIDDEWNEKAGDVEEFEVPLEKTDITVSDVMLVWLPVSR